ncbi:MAG: phosphoglycerate kinase [Cytophagales bacterium]
MLECKSLVDINFKDKVAIVRVDFNVPLKNNLKISDTTRIDNGVKSIKYVLKNKGKCVIMSHLGRPKGKGYEKKFSLENIISYLEKIFKIKIPLIRNYYSYDFSIEKYLEKNDIILLENLRFYPEEKSNNKNFAKTLASFADVYINDAFGTCHRSHASTNSIINHIKESCVGLLVDKELKNINQLLYNNNPPFTAILGGSKVSDKIDVIEKLIKVVDNILIGGAMANTFIRYLGGNIGNSIYEKDKLGIAGKLLNQAKEKKVNILLPIDFVCSNSINKIDKTIISNSFSVPAKLSGYDIGDETIKSFTSIIAKSKTIIWNGPLGVFEVNEFSEGTFKVADAISKSTINGAYSLVGGGDSVAAINKNNNYKNISFISTGGGALLEYIAKGSLPSLKLLKL